MSNPRNTTATLALTVAAGSALLLVRSALKRSREFDFRDKVVLITGGSRGLGLVIARQLAAQNARLAICARDERELEIARAELQSTGAHVLAVACDLTDRQAVKSLVDRVLSHFGAIDVLINNAGIITVGPIEHVTLEDYHRSMDNIFWATVHTTYSVVPHMQSRRSGRIVNVSSIGGKIGVPHLLPYCAAKFAVTGWSRGLRAELAKDNVWVTTVCPGLMRTGSPRNAEFQGQHKKEYAWFKMGDSIPGISVSAETAAHDLIEATRRGDVELIIGGLARAGAMVDQLMPELSGEMLSIAGRLLPGPGGIGEQKRTGAESETAATRTPITALTDKAAERNNELVNR